MRALRTEARRIDRTRPVTRGPLTSGPRAWWRAVAVTAAAALLGVLALSMLILATSP